MVVLIYAGIDEAGYGPMLGPLCVACAAFVLPDEAPLAGAPDMWQHLKRAVCRKRGDRRGRIAVHDSKKLKRPNDARCGHPLEDLERGVLTFLASRRELPPRDHDLFTSLGVIAPHEPWYDSAIDLPVGTTANELRIATALLKRAMTRAEIRLELLDCEAIGAARFNESVERVGRKSVVNLGAAMRHVLAVWSRWPHDHPRVVIDRQGGRTHYREELRDAFPDAAIRIIAESDDFSRYQLWRGESTITITFAKTAEDHHLPVALASMTAKYVRELLMIRLNRFFTARLPDVKPTAGYVQDARRFLRDVEPLIRDLDLPRRELVRSV